ncbi:hypothetical protein BLNAU_16408 [Blattamonas nauphoetae]|uniref:SH3 domain-containing protein n=1 Tax=Blattamonas nauphoetae TaxID=2049346 RepID=A0ABQ9X8D5_9EUKA|nr:hypothetical protein BLNAU_16408 [Blattamonas nauphoetae]
MTLSFEGVFTVTSWKYDVTLEDADGTVFAAEKVSFRKTDGTTTFALRYPNISCLSSSTTFSIVDVKKIASEATCNELEFKREANPDQKFDHVPTSFFVIMCFGFLFGEMKEITIDTTVEELERGMSQPEAVVNSRVWQNIPILIRGCDLLEEKNIHKMERLIQSILHVLTVCLKNDISIINRRMLHSSLSTLAQSTSLPKTIRVGVGQCLLSLDSCKDGPFMLVDSNDYSEVGDIIRVENETENGWTFGTNERTNQAGWIPTSYLGPLIAAPIRPSITPNSRQPNEKLVFLEAQVPQHAQLQSLNLIPFLQKFGEIISLNPISQSPFATHESYHIVLLTRVPFPTIHQSISKDPTANEVKLSLAPTQLDAKKLEIWTLPMGCSEAHLRTLISPHTSCTVVVKPSTSPSVQSSSASLVYPSEDAGIAAFRASSNWWFNGQAIKPSFASLSSPLRDASKPTQTPQNGVGEKKNNRFLELTNLPKKVTKDIVKSHLPGIEVGTITFINQDVAPGTSTVHMQLLTERDYNTVLGWNEKLLIAGRKIKIAAVKPKGEKQRSSSPPSRFSCGPIPAQTLPPSHPHLQPFRVNYAFDPTGYPEGVGVQKGEEVLVSEERADGWSVPQHLASTSPQNLIYSSYHLASNSYPTASTELSPASSAF